MAAFPALVAGDTVVDAYPDGRLTLDEVSLSPGGSGANVAVALARLYGPPRFHTALATDRFADLLAASLRRAGIDDDLFRRVEGETSVVFLDRPGDGLDWSIYHRPATLSLSADCVDDAVLADVEVVHLTGIALGSAAGRTALRDLAQRACAHGCTVSVDCNGRANMWDRPADYRDALEPVLARADLAFASPDDLAVAGLDRDPAACLDYLLGHGVERAVVTLGADGAVASDGSRTVRHGGYDVEAVNAAGAGDAFAAGAVGAVAAGDADPSLGELLAVGNAAGAAATTGDDPTAPLSPDRLAALAGEDLPAGPFEA